MNLDTIIQRYILSPPFASLSISVQWVYILEIMLLSFPCVWKWKVSLFYFLSSHLICPSSFTLHPNIFKSNPPLKCMSQPSLGLNFQPLISYQIVISKCQKALNFVLNDQTHRHPLLSLILKPQFAWYFVTKEAINRRWFCTFLANFWKLQKEWNRFILYSHTFKWYVYEDHSIIKISLSQSPWVA